MFEMFAVIGSESQDEAIPDMAAVKNGPSLWQTSSPGLAVDDIRTHGDLRLFFKI